MSKYLFLLFGILLSFKNFAQTEEPVAPKRPALSIDLGIDYLKLATLAFPNEDKYEGIAAINFGFGLSVDGEYGYTKKTPQHTYKNGVYTFEGNYYRVGFGYNHLIGEANTVGLGLRYARSDFEDFTEYTILSSAFEDLTLSNTNKVSAQWAELVLKSEGPVKKIKNLKLGLFIRLKFLDPLKDRAEYETFPVHAIPGYGISKANTTAAFNLFVKYSIPLIK